MDRPANELDAGELVRARRAPFLALPYPMIHYLATLPGDHVKIALRLLECAQWAPGTLTTKDGTIQLDAGEVLAASRSRPLWDGLQLDAATPDARRQAVRRTLDRLEIDGWIARRPAHPSVRSATEACPTLASRPATIVRFLKFREILWPGSVAVSHHGDRDASSVPSHAGVPIPPASLPPGTPGTSEVPPPAGVAPSGATRPGNKRAAKAVASDPRHAPLVAKLTAAFAEVRGAKYTFDGGRDAAAVTKLLSLGADDAEVLRRFRSALACDDRYRRADAIHDLPGRLWNAHADDRARKVNGAAPHAAQPPSSASSFTGGFVHVDGK